MGQGQDMRATSGLRCRMLSGLGLEKHGVKFKKWKHGLCPQKVPSLKGTKDQPYRLDPETEGQKGRTLGLS